MFDTIGYISFAIMHVIFLLVVVCHFVVEPAVKEIRTTFDYWASNTYQWSMTFIHVFAYAPLVIASLFCVIVPPITGFMSVSSLSYFERWSAVGSVVSTMILSSFIVVFAVITTIKYIRGKITNMLLNRVKNGK